MRKIVMIFLLISLMLLCSNFEKVYESSESTNRGLYVIVDSLIYDGIYEKLQQYVSDLEDDGYTITTWKAYGETPDEVKNVLYSGYTSHDMEGSVLIGNIDWKLSKIGKGAGKNPEYPCDLFYEDLDGEWIDSAGTLVEHNAGNGDVAPEIYVSRIFPHRSDSSDILFINNYFDRVHKVKNGNESLRLSYKSLEFIDNYWGEWWFVYHDQVRRSYGNRDIWATEDDAVNDTTLKTYYAGINAQDAQIEKEYEWVRLFVNGMYPTENKDAYQLFIDDGQYENDTIFPDDILYSNRSMFYDMHSQWVGGYKWKDYLGSYYLFDTTDGWKTIGVLASSKAGGFYNSVEYFYNRFGGGYSLGKSFLHCMKKIG